MKYYVAVDIGCIECREDSGIIGIFTDSDIANDALEEHRDRQAKRWRGQHCFQVFEIEEIDKVNTINYE